MKTLPHPGPPPTVGEGRVGGIFVAEGAETAKGNQTSPRTEKYQRVLCVLCVLCGSIALSGYRCGVTLVVPGFPVKGLPDDRAFPTNGSGYRQTPRGNEEHGLVSERTRGWSRRHVKPIGRISEVIVRPG